jgi:hypothetical protein
VLRLTCFLLAIPIFTAFVSVQPSASTQLVLFLSTGSPFLPTLPPSCEISLHTKRLRMDGLRRSILPGHVAYSTDDHDDLHSLSVFPTALHNFFQLHSAEPNNSPMFMTFKAVTMLILVSIAIWKFTRITHCIRRMFQARSCRFDSPGIKSPR